MHALRASVLVFLVTLITSTASGQPRAVHAPLTFVRLQGVDAKAGVYAMATVTETRYVPETRLRIVRRVVNGVAVEENVSYVVQVPVVETVNRRFTAQSHDVRDGDGKLVPAERIFERLANGKLVLISTTAELSEEHLRLLSPAATVLVPKKAAGVRPVAPPEPPRAPRPPAIRKPAA